MTRGKRGLIWLTVLAGLMGAAAQTQQPQQKDDVPDAPSATRPPQSFPTAPPAVPPQVPPATQPGDANGGVPPETQPTAAPPPPDIKTVPPGGATKAGPSGQEDLYTIVKNVNQVLIPVTVKDEQGRLVNGLPFQDFTVFENGVKQKLNFFTGDPLALSAAVIFDLGMSDTAVQKLNQTFPALEGAFSQFDEVSVYAYSNSVAKVSDFNAVGRKLDAVLNDLKMVRGRNSGPPEVGGPFGQGPIVNGAPLDPNVPTVLTPTKESHVLNDAVLEAALDLNKRKKDMRRVIFLLSDGQERGSKASYRDVLKVLLSNNIMVYAVGVEGAAIPGYSKLERLHLPRFGVGDILPKYANATGGEVFSEFSRDAIETAYARALGDARNQYTLGYLTKATPSSTYREIEVRLAGHGPSCHSSYRPCIDVTAKAGYYPMAISR